MAFLVQLIVVTGDASNVDGSVTNRQEFAAIVTAKLLYDFIGVDGSLFGIR
jgi:hypothetical protein